MGSDKEDGQLAGTGFRWIARADNGVEEILCTGSLFQELEAPEDGGFNPGFVIQPPEQLKLKPLVIVTDCASVDVELGLAPGAVGATVWTIVLEVSDSAGLVRQDFAKVTVAFVTG